MYWGASTFAPRVDNLFFWLVGLCSLILLLIAGIVLYFLVKYRAGNPDVDRSHPPETNAKLEIPIVAIFTIIMLGLFVWSAREFFSLHTPPKDSMEIYVLGKQWMWKFQHADGRTEVNELHIPMDKDIKLILTSQDVIHSLYIPAFRIKQDALPDRYTTIWFRANKTGTFDLDCTQYCGTQHAKMLAQVIVQTPEDFRRWRSGGFEKSSVTAESPLLQKGGELYRSRGCYSCHNANESPPIAPRLDGLFGLEVALDNGQKVRADENYLRESIMNPNAKITQGFAAQMPTFSGILSEADITALVEYLKSMKKTEKRNE